jgi:hypothetical protein
MSWNMEYIFLREKLFIILIKTGLRWRQETFCGFELFAPRHVMQEDQDLSDIYFIRM